jgi:hypothetical protein
MPNQSELRAGLEAAAGAGLISSEQVAPLADFLGAQPAPRVSPAAAIAGEEDLRFIRNFHDVFLATGIVLLSIGLAVAVGTTSASAGWFGLQLLAPLCAGAAAVLWALGEIFARQRRLFLPSIAICIGFGLFCMFAAIFAYSVAVLQTGSPMLTAWEQLGFQARAIAPIASIAALIATAAFYLRFRLPFSIGLTGGLAVLASLALVVWLAPDLLTHIYAPLILLGGLALFAAGVWFDMRDPSRGTRLSDNGFWLHIAAAPLILNGTLILVGGGIAAFRGDHGPSLISAIVTLAVVSVLGLTSLLINRRALIVSALLTTGIAVGILMNAVGLDAGALAASTLVVLGAGVLILGAGWHKVRGYLLARIPVSGIWSRIFPPEAPGTVISS